MNGRVCVRCHLGTAEGREEAECGLKVAHGATVAQQLCRKLGVHPAAKASPKGVCVAGLAQSLWCSWEVVEPSRSRTYVGSPLFTEGHSLRGIMGFWSPLLSVHFSCQEVSSLLQYLLPP